MSTEPAKSKYTIEIDEERISIGEGDNWPITWAEDGELYAFVTDGRGFEPEREGHIGSAPVMILGEPPNIRGKMIPTESGTVSGPHNVQNAKASGLVMVDGVFYCLLRNINPPDQPKGTGSSLMYSADRGANWTRVDWQWDNIGYPVWMNAGKNYSAEKSDFLYFVPTDGPSAYADYPDLIMGRVHRDKVPVGSAYEFFGGEDGSGAPTWGKYKDRAPIFSNPEGCFRPELVYNPGIDRYMLLVSSPHTEWDWFFNENPQRASYFAIYESESPWGPWSEIVKNRSWNVDEDRFQPRIPPKWISADGLLFYLLYSCIPRGPYQFNIHKCELKIRL